MKNFSELLDTNQEIIVTIKVQGVTFTQIYGLLDPITIELNSENDTTVESLLIDEFELIPEYNHLLPNSSPFVQANTPWKFSIGEPFYHWKHQVTHSGWLFYQNTK